LLKWPKFSETIGRLHKIKSIRIVCKECRLTNYFVFSWKLANYPDPANHKNFFDIGFGWYAITQIFREAKTHRSTQPNTQIFIEPHSMWFLSCHHTFLDSKNHTNFHRQIIRKSHKFRSIKNYTNQVPNLHMLNG
jgi:hypothetical protein